MACCTRAASVRACKISKPFHLSNGVAFWELSNCASGSLIRFETLALEMRFTMGRAEGAGREITDGVENDRSVHRGAEPESPRIGTAYVGRYQVYDEGLLESAKDENRFAPPVCSNGGDDHENTIRPSIIPQCCRMMV